MGEVLDFSRKKPELKNTDLPSLIKLSEKDLEEGLFSIEHISIELGRGCFDMKNLLQEYLGRACVASVCSRQISKFEISERAI